jgi:hypothetical protein
VNRQGPGAEPLARLLDQAVSRRGLLKGASRVAAALALPGQAAAAIGPAAAAGFERGPRDRWPAAS